MAAKLRDLYNPNDEYHARSRREALQHEHDVNNASLSDRQEARKEFGEALKDPALIAERIGWLIDGHYGFGEMLTAKSIMAHPRINRRAGLIQLIGVYEWHCPIDFGIQVWKKLTASQKQALNAALDIVIGEAEKEMLEEQAG